MSAIGKRPRRLLMAGSGPLIVLEPSAQNLEVPRLDADFWGVRLSPIPSIARGSLAARPCTAHGPTSASGGRETGRDRGRAATCRKRSSLHKQRQYQFPCVRPVDRAYCGCVQATRANYRTGPPASGSSSRRFQRTSGVPIAPRERGSRRDSTVLPAPLPSYAHGQGRQSSCRLSDLEARDLRGIDSPVQPNVGNSRRRRWLRR